MDLQLSYLLLRSLYEWPEQLDVSAHIWVNTESPQIQIPGGYVQDGTIQLNISPKAVQNLQVDYQKIQFEAAFSGQVEFISIPISAILAIYVAGGDQKLLLTAEEMAGPMASSSSPKTIPQKKPTLTLVD